MAAKVRPCVVISGDIEETDRALVTLIPHTTSTRATRFEAVVPVPFLKAGAFDAQGIVTVPLARLVRLLGGMRSDQFREVEMAVCAWLQLPCR